jgi:ornithine cyclodeaminase/mu-crystallin family protein
MIGRVTLLLSRSDLERLLDVDGCLGALEQGFITGPAVIAPQRIRTDLPGAGTATVLIPGLVSDIPAYSVKVNAKFPGARPALRGVVCLHDLATGELLAMADSATVTVWRTGLSAALGTHALARANATTLAVIGAGAQADLVVRGLAELRPLRRLLITDTDPGQAARFATRHRSTRPGIACEIAPDAATAAHDADIVVLATWSREPLLHTNDVRPGTTSPRWAPMSPARPNSAPACSGAVTSSSTTLPSPPRWAHWATPDCPQPTPQAPWLRYFKARCPAAVAPMKSLSTHRSGCPGKTSCSPGWPTVVHSTPAPAYRSISSADSHPAGLSVAAAKES